MPPKQSEVADPGEHAVAVARWASFLATIALIALLGLAKSAQALTAPAPSGSVAVAAVAPPAEAEDEGETSEDDGSEEAGECEEEDEECEEETDSPGPPEECLLSSASAAVSASVSHSKVRLAVRYTAFAAAVVDVDYRLRGSKGALTLDGDTKHFGKVGVFRATAIPSEAQMVKIAAAREFIVQLHAVNAPRYCDRLFERHLTVRRAAPGGLTWLDSESSFRR